MNQQSPERVMRIPEGAVEVHSVFYTIQGEGPFAGTPCVFVRLAGCNLQCPWCDTDYTSSRELMLPDTLLEQVADLLPAVASASRQPLEHARMPLVVITGGEPFRQNLAKLVTTLFHAGYRVQIETNGTLYDPNFPYSLATVVCSPKTPKINPQLEPHLAALKYVLNAEQVAPDGLPAHTMGTEWAVHRPTEAFRGEVYVQALDETPADRDADEFLSLPANRANLAAAVASALLHGYRLCIQTHKLTGVP